MQLIDVSADSGTRSIRVAICDSHGVFRRRLMMAIESDDAIAVIADADMPGELGSVLVDAAPHVLIVDLASPDGDALQGIRRLSSAMPDIAILALAGPGDDPSAALIAGARGAISKTQALKRGGDVVRQLASGEVHVGRRAAKSMAKLLQSHGIPSGVSHHHVELLYQLSAGRTMGELGSFFRTTADQLQRDLETALTVLRRIEGEHPHGPTYH